MEKPNELDCLLVEGRDKNGYLLKFTLRGADPEVLFKKWIDTQVLWKNDMESGIKPMPKMDTNEEKIANFTKEYEADTQKCPKCGNPLKESWSKDKTKHFMKCSTAGWDRANMRATGCDYIEWLK